MNMATIDGESSAGESHRSPKPRRRRTPTSARSAVAAVVSVAMIRYPLHPNVMQSGRTFVRPDCLRQITARSELCLGSIGERRRDRIEVLVGHERDSRIVEGLLEGRAGRQTMRRTTHQVIRGE